MVCLGNEHIILSFLRLHLSTAFQIPVDYDGYSLSSKGFLPTVVDIMAIWVKFHPFQSTLVRWFLECRRSLLPSPDWPLPICLVHGPDIPGSYAILLFTVLDFTSITSHIHNWALFLLWLCLFIFSRIVSPLISSSILGTYRRGEIIFSVISFCLFILFMGFSRQKYWSGLPFPSPMVHILSDLSTMITLSWLALHSIIT